MIPLLTRVLAQGQSKVFMTGCLPQMVSQLSTHFAQPIIVAKIQALEVLLLFSLTRQIEGTVAIDGTKVEHIRYVKTLAIMMHQTQSTAELAQLVRILDRKWILPLPAHS